jgi:hypothetical protein
VKRIRGCRNKARVLTWFAPLLGIHPFPRAKKKQTKIPKPKSQKEGKVRKINTLLFLNVYDI